ncbi:MAG TPA: hypothetical protein VH092_20340 [Urbifossiella sp.]|nr:hypothetical protein [Urbifossiella sp.]
MTPTCSAGCRYTCCLGTDVRTPQSVVNAPLQPALGYRVGTYADFMSSMLARLTTIPMPPLATDSAGSAGLVGTLVQGLNPRPASLPSTRWPPSPFGPRMTRRSRSWTPGPSSWTC